MVNGNTNGAIYISRGKEPQMVYTNTLEAFRTNASNLEQSSSYIREPGQSAFDAAAFHYPIYRGFL